VGQQCSWEAIPVALHPFRYWIHPAGTARLATTDSRFFSNHVSSRWLRLIPLPGQGGWDGNGSSREVARAFRQRERIRRVFVRGVKPINNWQTNSGTNVVFDAASTADFVWDRQSGSLTELDLALRLRIQRSRNRVTYGPIPWSFSHVQSGDSLVTVTS